MPTLIIRDAQLDALDDHLSADFRAFMAKQLRASFPQWAEGRSDLDDYIRRTLKRARKHGLAGKDQGTFIVLTVALGEDFDESREWAKQALADDSKDPATRLALVLTMARDLARS